MHSGRLDEVRQLTKKLHHADLADLLERLTTDRRECLIELLRDDLNPDMIAELDEAVL